MLFVGVSIIWWRKNFSVTCCSFLYCSLAGLVRYAVGIGTTPSSVVTQLTMLDGKLKSPRRIMVSEVQASRKVSICVSIGSNSVVSVSGGRYTVKMDVLDSLRLTISSSQHPFE